MPVPSSATLNSCATASGTWVPLPAGGCHPWEIAAIKRACLGLDDGIRLLQYQLTPIQQLLGCEILLHHICGPANQLQISRFVRSAWNNSIQRCVSMLISLAQ